MEGENFNTEVVPTLELMVCADRLASWRLIEWISTASQLTTAVPPPTTMVSLKFAAIAAAALSSFTAFAQEPETDGVKVHDQCYFPRKLSC